MTHATTPAVAPPAAFNDARLLAAGTHVDEFEILRPLGVGGFGIVYLAHDHSLLRQVALKEFMPGDLARRGPDGTVGPSSARAAEPFEQALESFFNEARLLARFNHPALVRVYRFWKARGTAYMAMQYYPGVTLKQARCAMHAPPREDWLRAFVEPVLGALERLHHAGVFHRDISPDNILLLPNGRPILLDFGSARRAAGPGTKPLTAVLKPNFAPIEQYGDEAGMAQGPWTDLYALGATVDYMLTGQAPTPAVMRVVKDLRTPLTATSSPAFPGVGRRFLAAIDWAAAVAPADRPQSVAALRQALGIGERRTTPATPATPAAPAATAATAARRRPLALALAVAGVLGVGGWTLGSTSTRFAAAAPPRTGVPATAPPIVPATIALAAATMAVAATVDPREALSPPVPQASRPASTSEARALTTVLVPASQRDATVATKPRPAPARPRVGAEAMPPGSRPPHESCTGGNFIARAVCVRRQCQMAGSRMNPECVEARRIEEQRQRQMER